MVLDRLRTFAGGFERVSQIGSFIAAIFSTSELYGGYLGRGGGGM